jgi:hypothetical protein
MQPTEITPKLRFKLSNTVEMHIANHVGLVRNYDRTAISPCLCLPKEAHYSWGHNVNQIRIEGLDSCKRAGMKFPVGNDNGHFRIQREWKALQLYCIGSVGVALVAWDHQQNLVASAAEIRCQPSQGRYNTIHLWIARFRKNSNAHALESLNATIDWLLVQLYITPAGAKQNRPFQLSSNASLKGRFPGITCHSMNRAKARL